MARLDGLLGRTARARKELDRVPTLIEKHKRGLLAAMFQRDIPLRRLSGLVVSTFYGPRIAKDAYVAAGIPTLRTTDISDWGRLDPRNPPQVSVSKSEFQKWGLEDGDLIVTRTGATIGKCAVYEDRFGSALPSAYLIRVRLNGQLIVPKFALFFLLSPLGQEQLLAGRTAVAQPNINANAILSVQLPLPSVADQWSIVARIESAFAWLDKLAAEHARACALLPKLEQALLAKAFRGELVPQDPNDESASALLERIRAAAPERRRKPRSRNFRGRELP